MKEDEVAKAYTKVIEAMESQDRRKRPRGTYTYFSPELRTKIGKFAAESGNKAGVEKHRTGFLKMLLQSLEIKPDRRDSQRCNHRRICKGWHHSITE